MPHVSLIKLQRGPTLKVIITILKVGEQKTDEKTTETINVGDVVEVGFKFKFHIGLTPYVRIKLKNTNVQNATVQIQVTANAFFLDNKDKKQIFSKQLFCSAEWLEATMEKIGYYSTLKAQSPAIYSYFLEVDISIHNQFLAVSIPNIVKLYEDTEFTDFQLHATDGNVPMHKAHLAANSDVFKAMMNGEWKEKAEGHINIKGVTVKTLQHLKDYMYLGLLPDEGLESLLVVAAQYLMDKLKADCSKKLIRTIQLENVDSIIKLACQHDLHELVKALIFNTPDKLVTDYYQSKIKEKKSTNGDKQ